MTEHAHTIPASGVIPTPRRNLFAWASAATLLAGTSAVTVAAIPMRDAGLIWLCRGLEQECNLYSRAASRSAGLQSPERDAADEELDRIGLRMDRLANAVEVIPVTTLAGLQALAAALIVLDEEVLNESDDDCANERLMRHLVKSVLALRSDA